MSKRKRQNEAVERDRMLLHERTIEFLQLLPASKSGPQRENVYSLLDHCRTSSGKELLKSWLKQPLILPHHIQERHDIVEALRMHPTFMVKIRDEILSPLSDVKTLISGLRQVKYNATSPTSNPKISQVMHAWKVAEHLSRIVMLFQSDHGDTRHEKLIKMFYGPKFDKYLKILWKIVTHIPKYINKDQFEAGDLLQVMPSVDPELTWIQGQFFKLDELFDQDYKAVKEDLEAKHGVVKRRCSYRNRWSYAVRAPGPRSDFRYKIMFTAPNTVYLQTQQLIFLMEQYDKLQTHYFAVSNDIIHALFSVVISYYHVFESLANTVAHLDVLTAFAVYADQKGCIKPTIVSTDRRYLTEGARHPLLQEREDYKTVDNDLKMMGGQSDFNLVTGPNAVGKSTFLRQVAIQAVMIQIGCPISCRKVELAPFDNILVQSGQRDSMLRGQSTFMVQMFDVKEILARATPSSLVIMDELGSGTHETDAFGIVYAISCYLIEKHIFTLMATHWSNLEKLGEKYANVETLCTKLYDSKGKAWNIISEDGKYNYEKAIPNYGIVPGVCKHSVGLRVLQELGYPQKVISMVADRTVAELMAARRSAQNSSTKRALRESLPELEEIVADRGASREGSHNIQSILRDLEDRLNGIGLNGEHEDDEA